MKFSRIFTLLLLATLGLILHMDIVSSQYATGAASLAGHGLSLLPNRLGSGLKLLNPLKIPGGLGGGLKLLNPIKGPGAIIGGLLAAHLGLMGPLKFLLLSKAGVALGALGTALGGTALGIAIKNKKEDDYDYEVYQGHYDNGYYGDSSYTSYDNHHNSVYRKKRDVSQYPVNVDEESFDYVKKSDPKRCTEKLICELSAKAKNQPLDFDELAVLSLVKSKNLSNYKSKAHSLYEMAARQGSLYANCNDVYKSCRFPGDQLMSISRYFGSSFDKEAPKSIITYVKS